MPTSLTLLERIRAQDPEAWERFVYLYAPLIYRWCRQAGLQEADTEDVGQEVFRAVSRSIQDYHHDQPGDTFRGWLRTITRNKVRDYRRRDRPEHHGPGGSDAQTRLLDLPAAELPDSDDAADTDERLLLVRRAVELLLVECEEHTRQAFWRVVIEGHAVADVAHDLGITANAIYVARSRILGRLRQEFAQLLESDLP